MTNNVQETGTTEAIAPRAEWNTPEVARISAGSAELDFSGADDGVTLTS